MCRFTMNQEHLADVEDVHDRHLILQLIVVAVVLIGAGLGLAMLG
jgi:hypothetical protein